MSPRTGLGHQVRPRDVDLFVSSSVNKYLWTLEFKGRTGTTEHLEVSLGQQQLHHRGKRPNHTRSTTSQRVLGCGCGSQVSCHGCEAAWTQTDHTRTLVTQLESKLLRFLVLLVGLSESTWQRRGSLHRRYKMPKTKHLICLVSNLSVDAPGLPRLGRDRFRTTQANRRQQLLCGSCCWLVC